MTSLCNDIPYHAKTQNQARQSKGPHKQVCKRQFLYDIQDDFVQTPINLRLSHPAESLKVKSPIYNSWFLCVKQ